MNARVFSSVSRAIAALGLLVVVGLGAKTADAQSCVSYYYGCAGGAYYGAYSPYGAGLYPYSYLNSSLYYGIPQITYTAFPYSGYTSNIYGFSSYFDMFLNYTTPGSGYYGLIGSPYTGYYGYGYVPAYGLPYPTASQLFPGYWNLTSQKSYCFPC